MSTGSYSRSASWTTTKSPVDSAIARRTAAPLPALGWRALRSDPISPANRSRISGVASVEPSSTTTISVRSGSSATRRRTPSIVRASLKAGTTTLTRGPASGMSRGRLALEPLAELGAPPGGDRAGGAPVGELDAAGGREVEQLLALLARARSAQEQPAEAPDGEDRALDHHDRPRRGLVLLGGDAEARVAGIARVEHRLR